MENSNLNIQPSDIANNSLRRNYGSYKRLMQAKQLIASGRTELGFEMIDEIIRGMAETDADIRSLRDMACNPVLQKQFHDAGTMPYAYSADHQCTTTGNPLRVPLVWNQTDKETGEPVSYDLPLEEIMK